MSTSQLLSITKSSYCVGQNCIRVDLWCKEQVSESLSVVGESKTGSQGVSLQGLHWSAGRLTSGISWVAGVNIALGMNGGEGGKGTDCAARASSDEESVYLTITTNC